MGQYYSVTFRDRMRSATALFSAASLFVVQSTGAALALPQGGQVGGGSAGISSGGSRMDITQSSPRALIDWNSFNIGSGETVNFDQPSSSAVALNRIHDMNPSRIDGALSANGQLWLVNSQGIAFGAGAQVNVGGLLATSSDIDNTRFMNGDDVFDRPGNPRASVTNAGHIKIADGGLAALAGPNVTNSGLIEAKLGKVQLASGDTFALDLYGDGLINLQASDAITSQLVSNSGTIAADGGSVLLTAAAARNVVDGLVNMSGEIDANGVGGQAGGVTMRSGGGTTLVSGVVKARGDDAGEKGGLIEALGRYVGILSGATLDSSGDAGGGVIRVGGDFHGGGATPTAERTVVQGSTNLYSNATGTGDGGQVAVWADDRTDFAGNIEARGGISGGSGGFVETSGKQFLSATGTVDAGSAWGKAGAWLLDPNNITIQAAGSDTNVAGSPNFTTTDDSAVVTTGSIQTALNLGTSVSITTGAAGANTQAGDITVADGISKTAGGDATLTLSAYRNIVVNATADATSTSGKLNVVLDSDNANNQAGSIQVFSNITTNGGNIIMGGGSLVSGLPSGPAFNNSGSLGGVRIGATLDATGAGGGDITLTGASNSSTGSVWFSANTAAKTNGGGKITIVGTNHSSDIITPTGGVYLNANSSLTAENGDIQITGFGATGGTTNARAYGLYFGTTTIKTTGSGNVILNGTGGSGSGGINHGISLNAATIAATGGGNITLNGIRGSGGGNDYGISTASGLTIGGAGNTGDITLKADSLSLAATPTIQTSGNVAILPYTSGTNMIVGGGATSSTQLNLTDTYLGYLNWGASKTLYLGTTSAGTVAAATAGALTEKSSLSFSKPVALATANGYDITFQTSDFVTSSDLTVVSGRNLTVNSGIAESSGGAIRLDAANAMTIAASETIGGNSDTGDITLAADSLTMNAGDMLKTSGNITIKPHTASATVGINDAGSSLNLTSAYLGYLSNESSLTIGDANDTGAMTFGGSYNSWSVPTTFLAKNTGSFAINASQTATGSGAFTFTGGPVTLGANLTTAGGGVTLGPAVTLSADSTVDAGAGTVSFGGTVDGAHNLTASAGTFGFGSSWGGATPLHAVSITSAGSLSLPAITSASVFARTTGASADETLNGALTASDANTAITLAAGRNFINSAGASALSAPGGRWLVYSTSPAQDTLGGLIAGFTEYNCVYGGSCPSVPVMGNGFLYRAAAAQSSMNAVVLPAALVSMISGTTGRSFYVPPSRADMIYADPTLLEMLGFRPGMPNPWWDEVARQIR